MKEHMVTTRCLFLDHDKYENKLPTDGSTLSISLFIPANLAFLEKSWSNG
jgi:hypothetical protein